MNDDLAGCIGCPIMLAIIFGLGYIIANYIFVGIDLQEAQISVECAAFYSEKMRKYKNQSGDDESKFLMHSSNADEYFGKENARILLIEYTKNIVEKIDNPVFFQDQIKQCNSKRGYFDKLFTKILKKINGFVKWYKSIIESETADTKAPPLPPGFVLNK